MTPLLLWAFLGLLAVSLGWKCLLGLFLGVLIVDSWWTKGTK